METIFTLLIFAGSMMLSFRMGYKAGRHEERILSPDPDIELPVEVDESERAPTDDEIREDMRLSRTIMTGYDVN